MSDTTDVTGIAALSICESLLLALNDHKILPEQEIVGILKDAAAALADSPPSDANAAKNREAATLIAKILAGGNSVRRP
jgi:hypothetical protein